MCFVDTIEQVSSHHWTNSKVGMSLMWIAASGSHGSSAAQHAQNSHEKVYRLSLALSLKRLDDTRTHLLLFLKVNQLCVGGKAGARMIKLSSRCSFEKRSLFPAVEPQFRSDAAGFSLLKHAHS